MSESFYGGRQGYSFIIAGSFTSYEEMVTNFKKGPSYTDIQFGEYAMLKYGAPNSLNGNIYRRGYEYNNSDGGAILIGNFTGAPGYAAEARICDKSDYQIQFNNLQSTYGTPSFRYSKGSVSQRVAQSKTDSISWETASFRNSENADAIYLIGVDVPAPTMKFNAVQVDSGVTPSIVRDSNNSGNFYNEYTANIPKGTSIKSALTTSEIGNTNSESHSYLFLELSDYNGISESDKKIINGKTYYRAGLVGDFLSPSFAACITNTEYNTIVNNLKTNSSYAVDSTWRDKIIAVNYTSDTNKSYLGYQYYHVSADGKVLKPAGGTSPTGSNFIVDSLVSQSLSDDTFVKAPLNSVFFRRKNVEI